MADRTLPDHSAELLDSPKPLPSELELKTTDLPLESPHPGQHPSIVNVPVTPGIHLGEYNSQTSSYAGGRQEGNSYFHHDISRLREGMAQSPSEAAEGAHSGQEILRRMSLAGGRARSESIVDLDPKSSNPALGLSGGIISATFCIPHSLRYRKGQEWGLDSRRGTSALFDSFAHLASNESPWKHTLVGWTGEIKPAEELTPPDTPPATTTASRIPPLNKASAPIPVDPFAKEVTENPNEGLWIGKEDQERLERQLAQDKNGRTVPIWLSDDSETSEDGTLCLTDQARWRRFAEHELYTLFHYKQHEPTDGRAEQTTWADYYRLNQKFADRIIKLYKPGDIVMIHDYHLFLLPSMLRHRIKHMNIAFFLHIPFPSSEFLRCLPRRKDILEGVLGANLIGFQSYSYSRHFTSCCSRILGFQSDSVGVDAYGSKVTVGVFPIGIDAAAVEKLAFRPEIDEQVQKLRKMYEGKAIIVGRDRLDSVRGVAQKLMAFDKFLEAFPEWRGKVVLIQVTSPTSVEEAEEDGDNKIANKVSELVAKINGLYGSLSFSPVQHYPQYLDQDEYLALLRAADIALITSVRDGMNTTSLEYVICQRDAHGPLILSEFSGTAGSLRDAIHINPWDLSGVSSAINYALTMTGDKKKLIHLGLYHHVTNKNVQSWSRSFIKRLIGVLSSRDSTIATPVLDKTVLLSTYRAAKKRLFMFDYDGTLTPIVKNPHDAIPSEKVIRTLKALASDPQNAVWIISGRDQEFLGQYLGDISELGFSAEHGSFMRHPGSNEWENLAETTDMSWQDPVMACFKRFTELTPGSFIERKRCALTWHYRPSDPKLGAKNSRECQRELEKTVGKKWEVEVMEGKANLEVRPTFINKGEIAKRLVLEYGSETPPEFVLCLGDDLTDEDMFRALNGSGLNPSHFFSVTVGASSKNTLAHWHLLEPADVISSVGLLAGVETEAGDLGALAAVEGKMPDEHRGQEL